MSKSKSNYSYKGITMPEGVDAELVQSVTNALTAYVRSETDKVQFIASLLETLVENIEV